MSDTARAFFVPEVLQTSTMDCGPAALTAVLRGFGLPVRYEQVRARCATDVDGTSLSALGRLAAELGLKAREALISRDALLFPEARCLPAIAITRAPGGGLHFVVLWRTLGPLVQVMDPNGGRRWLSRRACEAMLTDVPVAIGADRFRSWAASATATATLTARLGELGVERSAARALIAQSETVPGPAGYAALDAAARMVAALVARGAVARGPRAAALIRSFCFEPRADAPHELVPPAFRWVRRHPRAEDKLVLNGAVIVHVSRLLASSPGAAGIHDAPRPNEGRGLARDPSERPMLQLWNALRPGHGGTLSLIFAGCLASALAIPMELLLLRALMTVSPLLVLDYQRAVAALALLAFVLTALLVEARVAALLTRVGRALEARVRVSLLAKLPLLDDAYLRTRPSADMAARAQALHHVREIPALWAQAARAGAGLLATTSALSALHPPSTPCALALLGASILVPQLGRRTLNDANLRMRTQSGALERFCLDALLGAAPLKVHGAEHALRRAHEVLLVDWMRTARSLLARVSALQVLQQLSTTLLALWLIGGYMLEVDEPAIALLLAVLALRVPSLAQELVGAELALRSYRGIVVRLLAPLSAPVAEHAPAPPQEQRPVTSASLSFSGVGLKLGGRSVLRDLDLEVPAGEHLAVVGPSGAGKSSLLGLLLGWYTPSEGTLLVDGEALDASRIGALRQGTAWVDPAVHLWDRTLYDNLALRGEAELAQELASAIEDADLSPVLARLERGLQTRLGEGAARLSGGQAQRVRLARALLTPRPRLVLLDEPFRGLERAQRRSLLRALRARYRGTTLVFVSHDIADTSEFDRVAVVRDGRLAELGEPGALLADPASQYAQLVAADRALRDRVWNVDNFRRQRLEDGQITARAAAGELGA